MKNLGEILCNPQAFSEIVIGNTALVRGFIESGTRVITSYPGSPTPEIAQAIQAIHLEKRPFYFEFSVNEKVAVEVAFGASLNGHLSAVFFKSVGLNVAADMFVQLGLMEIIGGMVIILGDDPGTNSSQNEQDNRHYAALGYIPLFEPSTAQEAYDMYKEAARIAQDKHMPVIVRLTTHVCHQKQKVQFTSFVPKEHDTTPRFNPSHGPYIPITTRTIPMKRRALQKLDDIRALSETSLFHELVDNGNRDKGIIVLGLPYLSVLDVLQKALEKPDILKIGIAYPLPKQKIIAFLRSHAHVKIVEELDDILETTIKAYAYEEGLTTKISGKMDHNDWIGEYTPDMVYEVLRKTWSQLFPDQKERSLPASQPDPVMQKPIPRPPQLCPGCGHRSAFFAIKQALQDTDITVADIGCHTLGFLPPYSIGQVLMCMGASSGISAGLGLFNSTRPIVAFLGDSTFFHAGLPGIINALFNKHIFTLIIMENGTTAMTGHQDHPGVDHNFNEQTQPISIRAVLESLGIQNIFEVDAYKQSALTELVKKAVVAQEFTVIIASHPCMLKFTKEQSRKSNYSKRHVDIDQSECNQMHTCIQEFCCPTFTRDEQGRITINTDLCIGDGSCIQVCPTKAIHRPQSKKKGDSHETI